jgi:hypothetical protein
VEVLFFGLGCQGFWQTVEVDLGGDAAIDRQNHFIAFLCWSAKQRREGVKKSFSFRIFAQIARSLPVAELVFCFDQKR